MPVKYSRAAKFFNALVLILVALFAWPAASVVTTEPMPMDVTPSSYTPNATSATYAPCPSKRCLRSKADVVPSDHTDEERMRPPLLTKVEDDFQNFVNAEFARLRLYTNDDKLMERFSEWFKAVKSRAERRKAAVAMVKILREHYVSEDVTRLLVEASKTKNLIQIAKDMLDHQVQAWVNDKKTSDEVFKLLELDQTKDFFKSNLVSKWYLFCTSRYKSFDKTREMISTLEQYYEGYALDRVLVAGARSYRTKTIAQLLLNSRISVWLSDQITAKAAFKLLQLDQIQNIFDSQLCVTWANFVKSRYLDVLHNYYPLKKADVVMFSTLKDHYETDALTKVLIAIPKIEDTKSIASTLLSMQIKDWADSGKSSYEIFKLLELDQTKDRLFESPLLPKWIASVHLNNPGVLNIPDVNYSFEEADVVIFFILELHYQTDALAKVLDAGTKIESTKHIAESLQNIQNYWNALQSAIVKGSI